MELTNPDTWKCPESFHPDSDGVWEISELKKRAVEILKQNSKFRIELDIEDQTCVLFPVSKTGLKIGEAYVNRKENNSDEPLFSVFYEKVVNEFNSSSYEQCATKFLSSDGFVD
jgi:hypothetical protein